MGESEKKKLSKSYFDVMGICCSSEVVLVEKILKNLGGVNDVSVVVATKTVIVTHDSLHISQLQILKALNEARLEASIRVKGEKKYQKKWPSPFAMGSGILLALSFLKYFFGPFQWLAIAAVAIGIPPILFRGIAALRNFTLDINILLLVAVAGSIALRDYWEAASIVFLFTIAEWLESRASHKATAAMSSLVNIVPLTAFLAESGEQVSVEQVKVNSIVGVKAGETIPIDGVVVDGECDVDEKTLTGESFPVPKHKDSTVWAGTTNLNGYISVKTSALAEDCAVARMAKLVEDAQNNKSKTQRYIDKCAKYYTPVIVAISACLAIVPMALRVHNQKEWYRLALVVLVSACPCALVLSTPVAMCCALSKAAASGLLFKGAEYIETLAKIKIMAFDKTGTLTRGEFEVTEFRSLIDGLSLNTLLYWVSSVESKSGHPMAAALVDYAQSNSVELKPDRVEQFQNFPGEGIYGKIDGMEIYVGNRKISSRAGCPSVPEIDGDNFQGKSVGYIFLGSSPAGLFSLSDVCRTGVKDAMKELKLMGIKTAMLTGDCYAAAKHVQDELGGALGEFQAELLPEDKANIIKGFQKEAPTAMIGDGLNDAPALATADIGISMGISGSALANETGHVILMTNDIGRIPKAARLARRVRRKIIENMIISIVTKAAIVALAIAGYPLVWAAVLADTGTCLLVIMNSMLLLRGGTHTHGGKGCTSSHSHKNIASCCESANAPQLCCSDIESQKHCTSRSCSSEVYVPRYQPASSGLNNKQCHDSIEIKGCHSPPHSQCCSSKSKSLGNKNCSDSIPKNSCHSVTSSSPQCHPVDSCTSTKCSSVSNKVSCGSHTIPQSAVSCSKSCGNRKCSDKNRSHSHADHQTDTLKICGKTKCSDTILNVSHHSHANADSHCSKSPTPACPASISGSRSCGNSMCPDSASEHGSHSHDSNPVYEEKEQGSLDFVQEDIDSHHDHCHGFVDEEHHHTKWDKEGAHCHSTGQRCSPDLVDKKKCAQTCLTDKEHNHSHPDEAHDSCATQDCCFPVQGHGETESIKESSCKHEAEDHCGSHSKSSPTDQEVANLVRKCCKYRACHEVRSGCRKHATECGPAVRSTINILRDNHLHCSGRKVCSPLEKRHTGLCCKSFRKECCAKNNHFGGGLSEIVIE